jgi:hypothetical protein
MSVPNPPIFGKKQDEIPEEKEKRYAVPTLKEEITDLTPENNDILNYKKFFERKKAFHQLETGLSEKEAEWKAANDTVFQFMHNTGTFNESLEVRSFIESLYHMYPSLKE